jgi:PAS domain S-box-containing protein
MMPQRELERLQVVNRFLKLEFSKERELQEIVSLTAKICGTPTALITLLDEHTQHVVFKQAFAFDTTLRQDAFCSYVTDEQTIMVVPDTLLDIRFQENPLVTGDACIRFYAGAPLTTQDGHTLGSLCVINQLPGTLSSLQQDMLQALAKQVIQLLEFDASLQVLKEQVLKARRSEIELRSFFESSIGHHLLLGKNFEVLAFNKAWNNHVKNLYGVFFERGKSMIEYVDPDNLNVFYRDYLKALKGTAVYGERSLKIDGENVWSLVKFEPAFDADGDIIGVSVNSSNITKQVEQTQRVDAQNEVLRQIAFIQSHELRKPVASIQGLMYLLKLDGLTNGTEEWEMLEEAVTELDEKIRLVVNHTDIVI